MNMQTGGKEREWWEEKCAKDAPIQRTDTWKSAAAEGWAQGYNAAVEAYTKALDNAFKREVG